MQKINTLIAMTFCLLMAVSTFAQPGRYLQEVFSDVTVTEGIKYGENATLLFFQTEGEAIKEDLLMDVYQPMGDTRDDRPLVILFHTGNFLPPVTNGGIQGTRKDESAVEISTRLAKMGYVVASVDYRLGWNPLAGTQPERALGLIQAAYRGVQDGRTCIRYFKDDHQNGGNGWGIDPNRIACWGNGTGGYIVLGMTTLDEYNEIVTTTNGPGKFILDIDGDGTPDVPMVVEAYHGDLEGKVTTVAPDDAFLYPAGDTSCYSNFPDQNSDFDLAINVGGALGDISWIDDGDSPIISFHSPDDPFAPYVDDVLVVPTTNDPIVRVQGSFMIAQKQNEFGNNDVFVDAGFDDVTTMKAMSNATASGDDYMEALYPWVKPLNGLGLDEGVVIDWWDPSAPAPGAGMGIPWNMLPHPSPLAETFNDAGMIYNNGMSAEKAKANIDTIMAYFAPRAFVALDLAMVSTDNIDASEVGLQLFPNPSSSEVILTSAVDNPMQEVQLFDVNGRLLRHVDNVDNNYFYIDRGATPNGIYVVMVTFEQGVVSKKLVFK